MDEEARKKLEEEKAIRLKHEADKTKHFAGSQCLPSALGEIARDTSALVGTTGSRANGRDG